MSKNVELIDGFEALGELLESKGLCFDIVVIGGGALLMRDLITRPTLDMDVVALVNHGRWESSQVLPDPLVKAVREVAEALDLPREPRDEKDWLNAGPSFLLKLGLPTGFEQRTDVHVFRNLTVRIAARRDLITLKLWAATDTRRGLRRDVDVDDLVKMSPTREELRDSLAWCAKKDGRRDFAEIEARPVLGRLGTSLEEVWDD